MLKPREKAGGSLGSPSGPPSTLSAMVVEAPVRPSLTDSSLSGWATSVAASTVPSSVKARRVVCCSRSTSSVCWAPATVVGLAWVAGPGFGFGLAGEGDGFFGVVIEISERNIRQSGQGVGYVRYGRGA